MTKRRSSYRSLASLQRDNRVCRACIEAGHPLESEPVFEGHSGQRAYLFGLAPGVREGEEGRPWRGRAGRALRRWLDMDEEHFYATFYCSAVTRCYPGKPPSSRGDRAATPEERKLCAFWQEWELRLLGFDSLACVGERIELDEAVAIPLPHPSGASGWLNDAANRARLGRALKLLQSALSERS